MRVYVYAHSRARMCVCFSAFCTSARVRVCVCGGWMCVLVGWFESNGACVRVCVCSVCVCVYVCVCVFSLDYAAEGIGLIDYRYMENSTYKLPL